MRKFDDNALQMLPIRLMISIIIIAAISTLVAAGWMNFSIIHAENQIESQCNTLISHLNSLTTNGIPRDLSLVNQPEGSKRTQKITIPNNVVYLAFGVEPDYTSTGEIKSGLTDNGNVIFFQVNGGSKQVMWLDNEIYFREGIYENNEWKINDDKGEQGYIIESDGTMTLTFELVKDNVNEYVLIHSNDNIEN
jgi:hypothetical protein